MNIVLPPTYLNWLQKFNTGVEIWSDDFDCSLYTASELEEVITIDKMEVKTIDMLLALQATQLDVLGFSLISKEEAQSLKTIGHSNGDPIMVNLHDSEQLFRYYMDGGDIQPLEYYLCDLMTLAEN